MQVVVDGSIYAVDEYGSGKKTPVVIFHGWGRSKEEWSYLAKKISDQRKVYAVDCPGFGGSTKPRGIRSIYEYSLLIQRLIEYLGLKQVILVGHSLGGRIGTVLASRPTRIKIVQLILIDPAGLKVFSFKRVGLYFLSKVFFFVPRYIRTRFAHRLMDEDYRNSAGNRDLYRAVVSHNLARSIKLIKCPTLLIWGYNDNVLPVYLTKVYRKFVRDIIVRIAWNSEHDPHISEPDFVVRKTKEFIK